MTFTSSIPAVTDALIALVSACAWPGDTPQISDSDWGLDEHFREQVNIGDTRGHGVASQSWAALGQRHREENYAIGLTIRVANPGQTPKQARDRAFALLAVIETALRSTKRFGLDNAGLDPGVQVPNLEFLQPTHTFPTSDEGVVCTIHAGIKVWSRI